MGKKIQNNYTDKKSASQLARYNEQVKKFSKEQKKLNPKTIQKIPENLTQIEIEKYKNQLEELVTEANHRIEMIKHAGYTSNAIFKASIHNKGRDEFDLSEVSTREDLIKVNTALRIFINDEGSTIEGARLETAQIYGQEYAGKFGNQYNNKENEFARFDIKAIDKSVAQRAFEAYRKIEESRAYQITEMYGSENLIIALYDAEIRGKDSLVYGMDLLDTIEQTQTKKWRKKVEKANLISGITGIIEDNLTGGYKY